MSSDMYDVVVIGGGGGGVPAAVTASQLGGRVAILEEKDLGGLCMNRGCVPFGHMMTAAGLLRDIGFAEEMGLHSSKLSVEYDILKKRQDELIDFLGKGVKGILRKNKIELFQGRGRIAGEGRVEVNGKVLPCRNIILATGGKWLDPDFPGSDLESIINSDDLLNMDQLPEKVLLYGRSPWLIEIAQFLKRFGSKVTLATPEKTILPDESKTITSRLRKILKAEGIAVKRQTEIMAASKTKKGMKVDLKSKEDSEEIIVDRIIAFERGAALKDLGLKNVNLDEDIPYLEVNDRMKTEIDRIYAIGDVTGPQSRHYSHLSTEGGIVAAKNAMGKDAFMNPAVLTRVLFTKPEVACVGLTAKEAKNAGYDVIVGSAPCSMNTLGMIISEKEGIIEVVAEDRYGEVLGVHFIGRSASEMAGIAVLALQMEATIEDLANASFAHPTLSESLSEAARDALGKPIYLP